jgi:competence protein ComEC
MRNVFADFVTRQRGRLVLFLPVFLGAGICAYFGRTTEPSLATSALVTLGFAGGAALAWRFAVLRAVCLCALFAGLGFSLACLAAARAPGWIALPRHAVEVTGTIGEIDVLPAGRRVTLRSPALDSGAPLPRALRVRLRGTDTADLSAGDAIRVRCLLQPPAPPDYPGGRDTQREAFFAGLGGYGFAIGPATVLHHAPAGGLTQLREGISRRIIAALPGPKGAIASTLLTGIGTAIPPDDRAAFEASGLAHLLAVAGLHIGIVMGLVFFAARFGLAAWEHAALNWPTRRIAAVAALAAGFLYLELTGAHVPILRSFGMAALATLGVLTGRRAISLRGLALAALVVMAISPEAVVGVSFQMSFSAVLCLIAGYDAARPLLLRFGEAGRFRGPALYVAGLVLSSFLAGTASAPFAAYHFGRAGLYYVPANMLAVPLTALWVMPWGLAALALMPLGLEHVALVPMGWGIAGLDAIARAVAGWPAANVPVAQAPAWSPLLVAAGLAWGGLLRGRARWAGVLPIAAGLLGPAVLQAPDLLVAPGARLIALKLGPRVFVQVDAAASAYDVKAPVRLWGGVAAEGFGTQAPGLICDAAACRTAHIVLVRTASGVDCGVAVIVASTWLHNPCPASKPGALVIDHDYIRREGATLVRLAASGPIVLTDRALRGTRPWVLAPHQTLPMAPTE